MLEQIQEQNAREAEAYLAAIVASSDDAIIGKSLSGIIISWNPSAERIFGYKADEIIGKSILTIIPTERLHEEDDIIGKIHKGERVDHFETQRLHKNGTLLDLSITVSPIHDKNGKVIGASKVARDITDRSISEQKLRDSEEQLLFAQAAGGVGVFSLDIATNMITVTPEFCRIFGLPEDTIMPSTTVEALFHPDDLHIRSTRETRVNGQAALNVEYRIRHGRTGETRWIMRKAKFIHDSNNHTAKMLGVVQDITERKLSEQRLHKNGTLLDL
ncbi:MAG TPA: PAS domain S-box protein, partial [Alphaproteobacteria bacterium]